MKIALIISMYPICLYTIYVFIYVYVRYAQVFQGNTLTHPSHTHTLTPHTHPSHTHTRQKTYAHILECTGTTARLICHVFYKKSVVAKENGLVCSSETQQLLYREHCAVLT